MSNGRPRAGCAEAYARALRFVVSWQGDVAPTTPSRTAVTRGSPSCSAQPCSARTGPCVRPLNQAYQARTTVLMSPLRGGGRRRDAVILAVDGLAHFHERLAGGPHRHHVTRDVQAHRSR